MPSSEGDVRVAPLSPQHAIMPASGKVNTAVILSPSDQNGSDKLMFAVLKKLSLCTVAGRLRSFEIILK